VQEAAGLTLNPLPHAPPERHDASAELGYGADLPPAFSSAKMRSRSISFSATSSVRISSSSNRCALTSGSCCWSNSAQRSCTPVVMPAPDGSSMIKND